MRSKNNNSINANLGPKTDAEKDLDRIRRGHVTKHEWTEILELYRSGVDSKVELAKTWAVEEMEDTVKSIFHRRFHSYAGIMDDMYQEGRMAVVMYLPSFDETRSSALNYFYPRIQHAMMLCVDKHHGYSQYQGEMITKIKRAQSELYHINGKEQQSERAISEYTGIPLSTVIDMLRLSDANMGNYIDIDENYDDNDDRCGVGEDPADSVIKQEESKALFDAFKQLNETEIFVLTRLHGVFGQQAMTQLQVAKLLKTTSEKVARINNDAMYKLQRNKTLAAAYGNVKKTNYKISNSVTYFPIKIGTRKNIYENDAD